MSIWYPDWGFLVKTHEEMLRRYGGHPGIPSYGEAAFNSILEGVRGIDGIYAQAAYLLRRLRVARVFDDAMKRTSVVAVVIFLRMNEGDIAISDPLQIYQFIKDILKYDYAEIEEWLKNGTLPEEAGEGQGEGD